MENGMNRCDIYRKMKAITLQLETKAHDLVDDWDISDFTAKRVVRGNLEIQNLANQLEAFTRLL